MANLGEILTGCLASARKLAVISCMPHLVSEQYWYLMSEQYWYLMSEQHWYLMSEQHWYLMSEQHWYPVSEQSLVPSVRAVIGTNVDNNMASDLSD